MAFICWELDKELLCPEEDFFEEHVSSQDSLATIEYTYFDYDFEACCFSLAQRRMAQINKRLTQQGIPAANITATLVHSYYTPEDWEVYKDDWQKQFLHRTIILTKNQDDDVSHSEVERIFISF